MEFRRVLGDAASVERAIELLQSLENSLEALSYSTGRDVFETIPELQDYLRPKTDTSRFVQRVAHAPALVELSEKDAMLFALGNLEGSLITV